MSVMDFVSISVALTTLAVLLAIFVVKPRSWNKQNRYHPVAATVLNQVMNISRIHHYMTELASKYKTYRVLDLFTSAVYTADPANVEYVLKTNFNNYGKGVYLYNLFSDSLGDGIFAVDGEKWRHQRKASSSEFSTKVVRDFSSGVFKANAVKLARIICEATNQNQALDLQDLFMKSSLDSIIKILLGMELDSMSGTNEEGTRFCNAFDEASETLLLRFVDIFWKIKRFLNIGREARIRKNVKVVDQLLYKLLKIKMEMSKTSGDELSLNRRDLVSKLLESKETDHDPKYLRDMVLNFIIGGRDTTAASLSWFLYMMCKHLHIQEKIAQEVRESINLKDDSSFDELADSLDHEALNKMHYLHAALTETLRLYPPLPLNAKMCFSDDTWPDGFSVKKGAMVVYQPYSMGRMKFLWGDDAYEFRPERWLDENGLFKDESPFKFTAFQAGPRICIGKEHSYMQMKIFSAVLLGSCMFKTRDEKMKGHYKTMVGLQIDGGLYVKASPRLCHA